jgi:hypothetical protein
MVRWLKKQDLKLLQFGLKRPRLVIASAAALVLALP